MIKPKFKIGDVVNFTYLINPDGSYSVAWERWDDLRSHIGSGIIRFIGSYTYSVEIIDPPNYVGDDFGGLLKSAKGLVFWREALRLAQPTWASFTKPSTKTKVNFKDVGGCDEIKKELKKMFAEPKRDERAFFTKKKLDPNNPIPICPECQSPTTRPVRTIYCINPDCKWKMDP